MHHVLFLSFFIETAHSNISTTSIAAERHIPIVVLKVHFILVFENNMSPKVSAAVLFFQSPPFKRWQSTSMQQ
jgi:hypothetical protein